MYEFPDRHFSINFYGEECSHKTDYVIGVDPERQIAWLQVNGERVAELFVGQHEGLYNPRICPDILWNFNIIRSDLIDYIDQLRMPRKKGQRSAMDLLNGKEKRK